MVEDLDRWRAGGRRAAVARVVAVEGSAPRALGTALAVSEDGEVAGSLAGGCVEAAVVEEALDLLARRGPARCRSFGPLEDGPFAVGLSCGGAVEVLVQEVDWEVHRALAEALATGRPVALVTQVRGPLPGSALVIGPHGRLAGGLGHPRLDSIAGADALNALVLRRTHTQTYGPQGERPLEDVTVFVEPFARPPRLVIVGAVDYTAALSRAAAGLGYRVIVCDPRPVFATPRRFPAASQVVVDWPDRYLTAGAGRFGPADAVCVLTHDDRLDGPALAAALRAPVGYVGALGSRATQARRLAYLKDAGLGDGALARLYAPIGLDIGARTPEETAIAICAEIIAVRSGRTVPSLRDGAGPIH